MPGYGFGYGYGLNQAVWSESDFLIDRFPATAAYSLRKLSADYTGSAIRVRRDSDNAEQDIAFSGNDLDTAALESFVKSETTTLPADFGSGATAAYSLRYVTNSYSGAVVRVRRSSDNAEQDFTPSEITDGTMAAWVNTDVVTYESDFTSGNKDLTDANGIGTDGETINGVTDAYKFTLTGGSTFHLAVLPLVMQVGQVFNISYQYYIPSGQSVNRIKFIDSGLSSQTTLDEWVTVNETNKTSTRADLRFFASINGNTTIDADGDVFYLKNIVITQTTADGHVTTWYDQSGNSNDATQATAGSQPKVVDAGVLVTENGKPALDFDGVDDYLLGSQIDFDNEFIVSTTKSLGSGRMLNARFNGNNIVMISNGRYRRDTNDFSFNGPLYDVKLNQQTLLSGLNQTTLYQDGALVTNLDSGAYSYGNTDGLFIGIRADLSNEWQGALQELIIYSSDQSANRTEIEYAINDYYNIYTPTANGFVTTWYDQAGSNDVTQVTAGSQPKIYDSSTGVVLENGKPAINPTDRTNDFVINPLALSANTWMFSAIKNPLGQTTAFIEGDNANEYILITSASSTSTLIHSGYTSVNLYKNGLSFNPTTRQDAYNGLTSQSLLTASFDGSISTFVNIGYPSSVFIGMFQFQELIIYTTDQSANRTAIEDLINSHYNIYP